MSQSSLLESYLLAELSFHGSYWGTTQSMQWSVIPLYFTAQAFLFTIGLGPGTAKTARILSMGISILVTLSTALLFGKYRRDGVSTGRALARVRKCIHDLLEQPHSDKNKILSRFKFKGDGEGLTADRGRQRGNQPAEHAQEEVIIIGDPSGDPYLLQGWRRLWTWTSKAPPLRTAGSIWMLTMSLFILLAIVVIILAAGNAF